VASRVVLSSVQLHGLCRQCYVRRALHVVCNNSTYLSGESDAVISNIVERESEGHVMFQEDSRRFGVVLTKPGDTRVDGEPDTGVGRPGSPR
jgi:hypothetical protein